MILYAVTVTVPLTGDGNTIDVPVGIARLVFVSTDLVFDGEQGNYQENDRTNPLSIYAKMKCDAERVLYFQAGATAARTASCPRLPPR